MSTAQPIFDVIDKRGYIAGSFAAFMCYPLDDPVLPNDLDIFATSHQNALDIGRDLSNVLGSQYAACADFSGPVYNLGLVNGIEVQIVDCNPAWKVFPDDLLNDFDLNVCRAVMFSDRRILADENCGGTYGKILRINNPLRSLRRVLKYHDRKVQFTNHELLKLFSAWDQLPQDKKTRMIEIAAAEVEPAEDYGIYSDDDWFEGE